MSLALKCTRCKSYYDDYYTGITCTDLKQEWPYNAIMTIDKDTGQHYLVRATIDLCPRCKGAFNVWLNEFKEK